MKTKNLFLLLIGISILTLPVLPCRGDTVADLKANSFERESRRNGRNDERGLVRRRLADAQKRSCREFLKPGINPITPKEAAHFSECHQLIVEACDEPDAPPQLDRRCNLVLNMKKRDLRVLERQIKAVASGPAGHEALCAIAADTRGSMIRASLELRTLEKMHGGRTAIGKKIAEVAADRKAYQEEVVHCQYAAKIQDGQKSLLPGLSAGPAQHLPMSAGLVLLLGNGTRRAE